MIEGFIPISYKAVLKDVVSILLLILIGAVIFIVTVISIEFFFNDALKNEAYEVPEIYGFAATFFAELFLFFGFFKIAFRESVVGMSHMAFVAVVICLMAATAMLLSGSDIVIMLYDLAIMCGVMFIAYCCAVLLKRFAKR